MGIGGIGSVGWTISFGGRRFMRERCWGKAFAREGAFGAPEYVDLELYLMWRARGMKVETPAVRP